jgi:hypothetical protein
LGLSRRAGDELRHVVERRGGGAAGGAGGLAEVDAGLVELVRQGVVGGGDDEAVA